MADGMIQEIRRISAQLRPVGLDDLGLAAALEWYAGEFARRIGIPCNVRVELGDVTLERDLSTAAFRICQEALTNVARHAGASRVDVTLRLDADHLRLEVVDDGVGLPQSELADSPCWPARPRAARPSEVLPCETAERL